MPMQFTLDPCEGCKQTVTQSTPGETVWVRQDPPMPNVALHVCKACKKMVDAHNAPYEQAEREADRIAKEKMDAKLAEAARLENAKKEQEANMMQMLFQQNQMMMALLAKLAGEPVTLPAMNAAAPEPPAPPPPPPEPTPPPPPPVPDVPGLDALIGNVNVSKPRRTRRAG